MFKAIGRVALDFEKIIQEEHKAKYRNLGHAAASIRKTEIESIQFGKGPSEPGKPPHTHGRQFTRKGKKRKGVLQAAIIFVVEGDIALIGPRFSVAGPSGSAHEFGGEYKGTQYPQRPFAAPALEKNLDRFAKSWQHAIGK